jgi:DNA-directed RNA polymerase subunit K/omega
MSQLSLDHYTPTLLVALEEFSANNITVTVEWDQQVGATYYVRVFPRVPFPGNQLVLQYNTQYNLSVVASTPCTISTAMIELNYGESFI